MATKRIVLLAPYPFGQAPSQRFRFEQYIKNWESKGYDVAFFPFLSDKTWKLLYNDGSFVQKGIGILGSFWRRFTLLFRLKSSDIIFIHREASMVGPPVFEWIIAKLLRKKYIFDFDDAIWLPNYSESNAKFHRLKAYWKTKYIIKWAHKISAGNSFLANYARPYNENIELIPTSIDLQNSHNQVTNPTQNPIIIGWTGTHTTTQYLKKIVPVLEEMSQRFLFEFRLISNQKPDFDIPNLNFIQWRKETEIEDLSKINIGLMPLEETIWSKGKCAFKALQYMSLEIPAVVSPVGMNKEVIQHGENGFLCDSNTEWIEILTQLIENIELRKEIGRAGRKTVEEQYSVKSLIPNYLKLIQ